MPPDFLFRETFMKIVADANIPALEELFGHFGQISAIPGEKISREAVLDADVLLVRSVTRIDSSLLSGSNVRFVGSATAGTDHVDVDYLKREGITFANAPGSNADSVADYVVVALLELATITDLPLRGMSLGIVGVGAVGARVAKRAAALGLELLLSDPPREDSEPALTADDRFCPLDQLLLNADIVTLHVPLSRDGRHPTYHLLDATRLGMLKDGAWLINTARGEVVDPDALASRLANDKRLEVVLDVWSDEPCPDTRLIAGVRFGTPHIAGYAIDSKMRGAWMIARALAEHVGAAAPAIEQVVDRESRSAPEACLGPHAFTPRSEMNCLLECSRSIYDFRGDYQRFAGLGALDPDARAEAFRALRRTYPARRTFNAIDVHMTASSASSTFGGAEHGRCLEAALGVRLVERD